MSLKEMFGASVWWLVHRLRWKPFFHLEGYMERWWLREHDVLRRNWWSCRVHHILRSDLDRHLHDHPWPYLTVVMRGGYWEVTRADLWSTDDSEDFKQDGEWYRRRWYGPGSVLLRKATHAHRLILPEGQTAWTLFFAGRYQQKWGFYTERGKVPHEEYLHETP